MRMPQITEEVRLAPVRAMRAVFAAIGQLLLAADRIAAERAESPAPSEPAENAPPADNEATVGPAEAPGRAAETGHKAGGARRADMGAKTKKGKAKDARAKDARAKDARAKDARTKDARAKDLKVKRAKSKSAKGKDVKLKRAKGKDARAQDAHQYRSPDATGNVRLLTPDDLAELDADRAAATQPTEPTAAAPGRPAPVPGYDDLSLASVRARLRTFDVPKLRDLAEYERSHANRPDFVQMFERRIIKVEAGQV